MLLLASHSIRRTYDNEKEHFLIAEILRYGDVILEWMPSFVERKLVDNINVKNVSL